MIGRIKEDRIFEFYDVNTDGFAKALDFWAHFNESDIAVVSDSSDKVKCIVFNENRLAIFFNRNIPSYNIEIR